MLWQAPNLYFQLKVVFWAQNDYIQQPTRNLHPNVPEVIQNQVYLFLHELSWTLILMKSPILI